MTPLLSSIVLLAATTSASHSRLEQLVEANILGTHAFQVALAKKEGKGDPTCYAAGTLADAQLAALETHQAALMKADLKAVRAWSEGKPSAFTSAFIRAAWCVSSASSCASVSEPGA